MSVKREVARERNRKGRKGKKRKTKIKGQISLAREEEVPGIAMLCFFPINIVSSDTVDFVRGGRTLFVLVLILTIRSRPTSIYETSLSLNRIYLCRKNIFIIRLQRS
jgi:hypothetical protein